MHPQITQQTFIDDLLVQEEDSNPAGGMILFLYEAAAKSKGIDEVITLGIAAVEPRTGVVVVDSFTDNCLRTEVESRLLQLRPVEIHVSKNTSSGSKSVIRQYVSR